MTNLDHDLDRALLSRFGFDEVAFQRTQADIKSGRRSDASAILQGKLEPPLAGDVVKWADAGADAAVVKRGRDAIEGGKVAVVVLAGGMATRFGGAVKACVDVVPGKTFLDFKLEEARRAKVPLAVMTSFATDAKIRSFLEERGAGDVLVFNQRIAPRLTPAGEIFREQGKPSYNAPGHGDFFWAIRESGTLRKLRERGVEVVLFQNVDNLGATVDPRVIGVHLTKGADMTMEVVERADAQMEGSAAAGIAARHEGRLRMVEGFRLPPGFDFAKYRWLNTNTIAFSVAGLERDVPLVQHIVKKKIDGQPALQIETVTCEATELTNADGSALLKLALLEVPARGREGRFYPVKEPADMDGLRAFLKERGLLS